MDTQLHLNAQEMQRLREAVEACDDDDPMIQDLAQASCVGFCRRLYRRLPPKEPTPDTGTP